MRIWMPLLLTTYMIHIQGEHLNHHLLRFVMAIPKADLAPLRCIALTFDHFDALKVPEQPHLKELLARLPGMETILVELGYKIYWEAHGNLRERTFTARVKELVQDACQENPGRKAPIVRSVDHDFAFSGICWRDLE